MKRSLIFVAVLALLLAAPASGRNFKATLELSPAQPVLGQQNTMSGCGYKASEFLKVYVIWPAGDNWTGYDFNTAAQADGCFSATWTPQVSGLHRIYTYQPNNGKGLLQMRCMIEFTVL